MQKSPCRKRDDYAGRGSLNLIINASLTENAYLFVEFHEQLIEYYITALHQQLGLFVVIENPTVFSLDQVLGQHPGQPVFLDLRHVLLAAAQSQHFLFFNDYPAVSGRNLKQLLLGICHIFLNNLISTFVSSNYLTWSKRCDFFHGKGLPNDPKFLSKSRHSFRQSKQLLRKILFRLFKYSCLCYSLSSAIPCFSYLRVTAFWAQKLSKIQLGRTITLGSSSSSSR